jgi:hypothetical protein
MSSRTGPYYYMANATKAYQPQNTHDNFYCPPILKQWHHISHRQVLELPGLLLE